MAKSGGKTGSKRAAKAADDERVDSDKGLTKSGKAARVGKAEGKRDERGKESSAKAESKKTEPKKAKSKKAKSKKAEAKKADARKAEAKKVLTGDKGAKAGKPKRHEGAERLVERVAAQIIAAEFDRVLEESRQTENGAVEQGRTEEAVAVEAGAVEEAVTVNETVAVEAEPELEPEPEHEADGALHDLLRVPAGAVDLADYDPSRTPGVASRAQAEAEMPELVARLDELQERLFAAARGGDSKRRILLVLQGMDTSGKGGTIRHVVGQLDPNGVRLKAFKAPTEEERAHDFLWRIRAALPDAGEVGIFDRSHYEDVLAGRVRKLALPMVIGRRYILINKFEKGLVDDGCIVVKCFLHISPDEQRDRLLARLDKPAKHWKYNPGDVDDRKLWPEYQDAYRIALEKTSTEAAPWHVVPANRKWYRNYAITRLLVEALEGIDPQYPAGGFDVAVERERVLGS